MNVHEERAWKLLVELGAKETTIHGKHALDLSTIRATTRDQVCLLVQAAIDVVGRSNANRRHVDRRGCPVYVVTDFYTIDRSAAEVLRDEERRVASLIVSLTRPVQWRPLTDDEVAIDAEESPQALRVLKQAYLNLRAAYEDACADRDRAREGAP